MSKNKFAFIIEKIAFGAESNDAYLDIRLPYRYDEIKEKINIGDKIEVTIKSKLKK